MNSGLRTIVFAAALSAVAAATAQLPPVGANLLKQMPLSVFGSSSGNDCWGYVSPSGREYAIMGLNNKISFVEITNPVAPILIASIPHSSSTWGDIKVYQHYAYAVTEASGTGIQVVDMSEIDNGIVTLVRTIPSPGRSHNVALDPVSGFLYTCGSRNGTGTTMCFSLADPSNPVQVGAASMTANYQHDGMPVTYTEGPLAGRQLWFGCSESRGVDIYDFTDKNNPFLIKRVTYPDMGYCHQAWLSDDKKFLYVDDEFDESNLTTTTRSLIFNVEDPANATFVDSFTSGLMAIDHNQYVADGFTFQANYRSGLRIFDVGTSPTAPIAVGSYDTYPANNNAGYNGAWSTYPFFPSGNVIVSDIERGLFVLDVTEATTRKQKPLTTTITIGEATAGDASAVFESDDQYLVIQPRQANGDRFVVQVVCTTKAYDTRPLKLKLLLEAKTNHTQPQQQVELWNWSLNSYEAVDTRFGSNTDTTYVMPISGDLTRFVNSTTREIKARYKWSPTRASSDRLFVSIDKIEFQVTR